MRKVLNLEKRVHSCTKCNQGFLRGILPHPPVYSFGNPEGKEIIVVGLNPSAREYINGFLSESSSIEERRKSQLAYFHKRQYRYFSEIERFFGEEVKKEINWTSMPWERIGYLDLVKCPTKSDRGQWSKMSRKQQNALITNCEGYLKEQLAFYKPKIILAYGVDVSRWFANYLNVRYEEFEDQQSRLSYGQVRVLFIPQRQSPHSKPEILWIREKIMKILK